MYLKKSENFNCYYFIEFKREKQDKKMKNIIIDSEWKGWLQTNYVSLFIEKRNMITHKLTKAID